MHPADSPVLPSCVRWAWIHARLPRSCCGSKAWSISLAFLTGIGLGALLIVFVAPAVTLLDLTGLGAIYNPYDVPALQTVIPYLQIVLLLVGLVIVCLAALLLMAGVISRPSPGQRLRLNED